MADDLMSFSLDWLAGASIKTQPLAVCEDGHLKVRGNTCWSPSHFSPDFKSLYCRVATHEEPT